MTAATKQFLKVRTVFPECVCQNISKKKKNLNRRRSYLGNIKIKFIFDPLLYFSPKQLFKSSSITNILNVHYLCNLDLQFI